MPIHMVTQVGGEDFQLTLSCDEAGNYVAEAVWLPQGDRVAGSVTPRVRVVHPDKERTLQSLFDLLRGIVGDVKAVPTQDGPSAAA